MVKRALLGLVLVACGEREAVQPIRDAGVGRRVFDPPVRKVRAVAPYNVHADGVGPYRLGAPLREVLALLPHGPRVELLQIDRVVDSSLVRTDSDKLVIGASRTARVVFVSAVAPGIAVTDDALEVGTVQDEAARARGAAPPGVIADPRILHGKLPNLRLVIEDDGRVIGMIVTTPPPQTQGARPAATRGSDEPRPSRCAERAEPADVLVTASKVKVRQVAVVRYGCFGGDAEVLVVAGSELAVVGGEPGKPRRLAGQTVSDLDFAAGLDVDDDGRQEIVAVVQRTEGGELVALIHVFALDGGRLTARTREAGEEVYRLSSPAVAWVGAKLREIELLLEVAAGRESLEIGGLYLRHAGPALRDIALLTPVTIALPRPRRRGHGGDGPNPPGTTEPPAPVDPTRRPPPTTP